MFCSVSVFEVTALLKKGSPIYRKTAIYRAFHTFSEYVFSMCASLKCPAVLEAVSPERNIIHCFLVLLILFPFKDTRCLHCTESECHEQCRTHAQEPVCHGIVSGLRQVDFCVGRICTGAGLWVNGVNVQHIAVFVGQRNLASILRACGDFCICRCNTGFLLVVVDRPAAKIFVCNVGHACGGRCCSQSGSFRAECRSFCARFCCRSRSACGDNILIVFIGNICGFSSKFFCRQGKNLQAYFRMARIFNAVCNKICRKDVDRRL